MKKNEIEEVINNYFKRIEKLFHKIIIDFETEDIQQFRTEIKKLRAFFHLLDMEVDEGIQFKITIKMKTVYGYTGIIRNLQLQLKNIYNYSENSAKANPVSYIAQLEKEIEYWKKNTKEFMDLHNSFHDDEQKVITGLPGKLRKRSIKKFTRYIMYELQKQLTRFDDDETLHSIRKLLEDILYNWTSIQPYTTSLLQGLSKEEIKTFVQMLTDFRDKCISYTFLQTYNDSANDGEKAVLENITHISRNQKENLKQSICLKLELIPINPIVTGSFSFKHLV